MRAAAVHRKPAVLNKPRDKPGDLTYIAAMIRAAAVFYGHWFGYPHTLAEAGARLI